MSRFNRLTACLLLAFLFPSAIAQGEPETTRTIWLFIIKPQPAAQDGVGSWTQLFKHNVPVLLSDIQTKIEEDGGIPPRIVITTKPVDDADREILKQWWQSTPSLHALSAVGAAGDKAILLDNDIYLGELKGSLADPYVHFSEEIVPSKYRITHDALSIVTLYAYAMGLNFSASPNSSSFIPCLALQKAALYAGDLDSDTKSDLAALLTAVNTQLGTLKCAGE